MNELKRMLGDSTESEVKSLLFQLFLQIQRAEEMEQYAQEQFAIDIRKTYNDFLIYKRNQANPANNTQYKKAHIVFGYSGAGSLKMALREMKLRDQERIIAFSDIFSVGPVWQLHEKAGIGYRQEWLKNHINLDDETLFNYQDDFQHKVSENMSVPDDVPIFIWVGENAHEQTALRFVLYLLKEKSNDVFVMNATSAYKAQFWVPESDFSPLHTGEIAPEKLRLIYEENRKNNALTQNERKRFEKEWAKLASEKEVLRIWENEEINSVDGSYYDEYLISTARKIHRERKNHDFIKCARLIGEAIGHITQYIGDQFLEYRVRHLILNGCFEIEGVPKAMRYYSVRLKG